MLLRVMKGMLMHKLLLILLGIIPIYAGQLYNPIQTRNEILDYYYCVKDAWKKDYWPAEDYINSIDFLKDGYFTFVHSCDQIVDDKFTLDKAIKYIKRINRLHNEIVKWAYKSYVELDFQHDDFVLTPNYQNLSENEFDYSYEEIN